MEWLLAFALYVIIGMIVATTCWKIIEWAQKRGLKTEADVIPDEMRGKLTLIMALIWPGFLVMIIYMFAKELKKMN